MRSMLRPPAELHDRLRAGDRAAFDELVERYQPRLGAVARRMLSNDEDVRDVLQVAFLSAYRSIGSFQGEAKLSTWLHRIVVNAALMKLRSKRRKPLPSLEDVAPAVRAKLVRAQDPDGVVELLLARERAEVVREAIAHLPRAHREVLALRELSGLDTNETSELLGIRPGAVKTRLFRARAALRELLAERFRPSPPGASGR